MKKNGRSIRNGIILACVCVGLATAYFLITAKENPAARGVLYELGGDKIAAVRIDNQYGSFAFEQQGSEWVVDSGGIYRTNPEKINLLLGCLEKFSITRMLPDEKSEYGLSAPQAEVWVTTQGGKVYSLIVGADAVSGSSVYIKSDGNVMLTSTAMTSQLTGSLAAYRAKDVLMVDPAHIRSIVYYENGAETLSVSNTDYHNWTMGYPFSVPAREVVLNELIARLRTLTIAGYAGVADADTDNGLSAPAAKMVLTDESGVQQTLEFGAVSDTLQYVRIGAQKDIVQLYATDLDFSKLTPEGVMYLAPLDIDITTVGSISIQTGGMTDTFTLDHSGAETTAKLNGAEISYSQAFVPVYFKCITLNADGYDANPAEPGVCEVVCTTTLTSGETIELSLYGRDADTLYLYVDGKPISNGQTMFYMDRSSLSEMLYRLECAKAG